MEANLSASLRLTLRVQPVWDINGTIPADKFSLAMTKSKHNYIGSLVVSAADLLGNIKEVSFSLSLWGIV